MHACLHIASCMLSYCIWLAISFYEIFTCHVPMHTYVYANVSQFTITYLASYCRHIISHACALIISISSTALSIVIQAFTQLFAMLQCLKFDLIMSKRMFMNCFIRFSDDIRVSRSKFHISMTIRLAFAMLSFQLPIILIIMLA